MPFRFLPGQYLNFRLADGKRILNRSYSICSAPEQMEFCEIAVKRSGEQRGSDYLHRNISVGDTVTFVGPLGGFTFTGEEADSIVLIAGGIGITPFLSVMQHLARAQWPHEVFLVFAVSTPADIIFEHEIRAIAQRYQYLRILFLPSKIKGLLWEGPSGRLRSEHLTEFIPQLNRRRVHLCGPDPMMVAALAVLHSLSVPDSQIHTESFGGANVGSIEGLCSATISFSKSAKTCFVPAGTTLLDAAEQCGVEIESLCRIGTCGTCKVKVISGDVNMQRDDALTTGDIRHHIVLACQARSTTPDIQIEC